MNDRAPSVFLESVHTDKQLDLTVETGSVKTIQYQPPTYAPHPIPNQHPPKANHRPPDTITDPRPITWSASSLNKDRFVRLVIMMARCHTYACLIADMSPFSVIADLFRNGSPAFTGLESYSADAALVGIRELKTRFFVLWKAVSI